MIVYHGSTCIVEHPDTDHSYRRLDFGKGFYVTTNREQAERWAGRKADILGASKGMISIYEMSERKDDLVFKEFEDLGKWLDFVCGCRDGSDCYREYDIIYGKVANDKVFRVVDMYKSGVWDKERALEEIKVYPSYDQYAFITQKAIEEVLAFQSFEEVSL